MVFRKSSLNMSLWNTIANSPLIIGNHVTDNELSSVFTFQSTTSSMSLFYEVDSIVQVPVMRRFTL
jgi:hypothetical protein